MFSGSGFGHGSLTLLHGLDDVLVARATAQVAFEQLANFALVGFGWFLHRSTALMTMPGVQKPHCKPWQSLKAACMGCMVPSASAMPSMVVISAPLCCTASVLHDLMARPLTSTVQAPHWAVSQPTWVPVSLRFSRMTSTKNVLGATSTLAALPLTLSCTCIGLVSMCGLELRSAFHCWTHPHRRA
jgi:hypothetical protein